MSDEVTPREVALTGRIDALRDARDRPVIQGAGHLGDVLNFVSARGPVLIVRAAFLLFIGYFAWTYYGKAMQIASEVATADAEARRLEVEAAGKTQTVDGEIAQTATLRAELNRIQAEADAERARVEALNQNIDGDSARFKILSAELEKTKAERDKAQAEVDAQLQVTADGVNVAKARAQAQLSKLEGELAAKIGAMRMSVKNWVDIENSPFGFLRSR